MYRKITGGVILLLLLTVLFLNGTLSYKGYCGNDLVNSPLKCACVGSIRAVIKSQYNDYYCAGMNFSFNRIFDVMTFQNTSSAYFEKIKTNLSSLPNDFQKCSVDNDCMLVKNSCRCNCSEVSGKDYELAINKKYETLWEKNLACNTSQATNFCPLRICPVAKAVCVNNTCKDVSIAVDKYIK